MKKGIIGAGGFGREIYWSLPIDQRTNTIFFVDDKYFDGIDPLILPLSKFNPLEYEVVIAIADSNARQKIRLLEPDLKRSTKFENKSLVNIVSANEDAEQMKQIFDKPQG